MCSGLAPEGVALTHAGLAQGCRGELAFGGGEAELVGALFLVLHAQGQVTTGLQVVAGFQGVPRYLVVVVVLGMGFGDTPQVTAAIVLIDDCGLPGVLVDIEVTLGIDVALAGLEGGFHVPDAVQLVAGQILVDMTGLEDVRVLEVRGVQAVAVVRDVQLLLADQFPVVAIRGTVVHVQLVGGAHAVAAVPGPS